MVARRAVRPLPVYDTLAEVHRMLEQCVEERDRRLIELLWHTGARVSEVVQLRVGDLTKNGIRLVNLKQGLYRVDEDGSKVHVSIKEQKHVFLPADFLERLTAACRGRSPAAPIVGQLVDERKPISRVQAWRIVTRAARLAGVSKRRFRDGALRPAWPHTLRHGYAVNLLEQQVPITVVQAQLGHHSLRSTEHYTRISDPRRAELIRGVKF